MKKNSIIFDIELSNDSAEQINFWINECDRYLDDMNDASCAEIPARTINTMNQDKFFVSLNVFELYFIIQCINADKANRIERSYYNVRMAHTMRTEIIGYIGIGMYEMIEAGNFSQWETIKGR